MTTEQDQKNFEEDQEFEAGWWDTCNRTFNEEYKHIHTYAPNMGLEFDGWKIIDLKGKSVLDVGGGPISMLLKTRNAGRRKVIDPLPVPDWVPQRYIESGIEYDPILAENMQEAGWDEVWMYNVLQHTKWPLVILEKLLKAGKVIRIFEWVNTGVSPGHRHNLTTEMIEGVLGPGGKEVTIDWGNGTVNYAYTAVLGEENTVNEVTPLTIDTTDKKRFHMPALPHTVTNKKFLSCAYTQKVHKLAGMLTDLGHEVYHYGVEGSTAEATENIDVVGNTRRRKQYPNNEDMTKQFTYDTSDDYHKLFNERTIKEIQKRQKPRDFLLCPWGWGSKPIADALGTSVITVESGIGYPDTWAPFRVFESYTWMNFVYGKDGSSDGKFYDAVIPNYFELDDFEFQQEKEDYFLYLGRIVHRKGVKVAVEMTRQMGAKLVIAGQGTLTLDNGETLEGDHIEFVGHADVEKRKKLLAGAKALICPTYYIGPFEGVSVEAMLSGTPVICTDFGAYAENVLHGITGYRCKTLEQFVWAGRNIHNIDPHACYNWAVDNFSCDRVAKMYDEYFAMLYGLHGEGWPMKNDGREELDWLRRYYP